MIWHWSSIFCLLRLTSFSILQGKSVLFESFWLHIHPAITVRQFLPVHLSHSTSDFFTIVCSRNGLRSADLIIWLSLRHLKKFILTSLCCSLFVFQSDVIHIHISPVEPMPSRLCHRFIVRSLEYLRKLMYFFQLKRLIYVLSVFNLLLAYLPTSLGAWKDVYRIVYTSITYFLQGSHLLETYFRYC